jgi:hypothetical protein
MDDITIAKYIQRIQEAIAKAQTNNCLNLIVLINESELLVQELANELQENEGIRYSTSNEILATARTMLWTAWTSWLWTCKSERDQMGEPEDIEAKIIKPIFENLIKQANEAGKKIGARGRIPTKFIEEFE